MISTLERQRADKSQRVELQRQLSLGPWCWPLDTDQDHLQWAQGVAGQPLPSLGAKKVLVVTACRETGVLWLLADEPEHGAHETPLNPDTRKTWDAAALALPRSVPVLWKSVKGAHDRRPEHVTRIASFTRSGMESQESCVEGPSLGVAFLLLLTSRMFNAPVPADVVSSATIEPDGKLGPVEKLDLKIRAVIERAPRIRRFLVHASQLEDARGFAGTHLQIVPVTKASEALAVVFGEDLKGMLVRAGSNDEERGQLVDSFFRLARLGRGGAVDWSPIERAAGLALEKWVPRLSADERYTLEFARAVAGRHEGKRVELGLPPEAWLASKTMPVRVSVAAHMVQHCADTNWPNVESVRAFVARFVPLTVTDAHVEQLRLMGSMARLDAVTGHPEAALRRQEELAEAFLRADKFDDVCFPLSEWFRLAGDCRDEASFLRAESFLSRVETLGGLGLEGSPYVLLTQGRACVLLSTGWRGVVAAPVRKLFSRSDVPPHVRWSAGRWLAFACLQADGDRGEHARVLEQLRAEAERTGGLGAAAVQLRLAELDVALATNRSEVFPALIDALTQAEEGLLRHLLAASSAAHAESPAYVARYYPY